MREETLILWIGNGLGIIDFFVSLTFIFLYTSGPGRGRWWKTDVGRWLMALAAVIATIFGLSFVRVIFGVSVDVAWFSLLRLFAFGAVTPILIYEIVILRRENRKGDDESGPSV